MLRTNHSLQARSNASNTWQSALDTALDRVETLAQRGHIESVSGAVIRARGFSAAIGELCELHEDHGSVSRSLGYAEVIGLQGEEVLLCSLAPTMALSRKVRVIALDRRLTVRVGPALLGRVLDGLGRPIDAGVLPDALPAVAVEALAPEPLQRQPINTPLISGVRAIDAFLSVAQGQRVAILSPAGAGKSRLLADLARQCAADVVVLALVGERGREVGDLVREQLGAAHLRRCVVLAATSDRPAIERIKCALTATAVAEHFRAHGKHVLLLVDSLTRLARAQRELALSQGEPLARDGLPASVYSLLPALLERVGLSKSGAISAFYTVLTDDNGNQDGLAEEVRSIVDGHIVLSRRLANAGHFPAIDLLRSSSRLMHRVTSVRHQALAQQVRTLLSKLDEIELLLQVGEYRAGTDPLADRAIALRAAIDQYLRQAGPASEVSAQTIEHDFRRTEAQLDALLTQI